MGTTESRALSTCTVHIERRGGRGVAGAGALERHLQEINGVHDVEISFRTGSARVVYDEHVTSEARIRNAVRDRDVSIQDDPDTESEPVRTRSSLRWEAVFVGLTLVGMVTGLVTGWLDGPPLLQWAGYGVAYVFGGWYGLIGAIETLRDWAVDIDLLMIVAALGALSIGAPFEGTMLLFLFSLSNTLQHYAIGRSRRAISSLVEMRPDEAKVRRDGEEVTVPIADVAIGDVFVVRPGDRIPLDGVITAGEATVDQSSLTGESVPVTRELGNEVFGGTIIENGSLEIEVTRLAHESAISRLIHMVERAQSEKAPTQRLIDRFEQPYVLGVFALTIAAIAIPLALGNAFTATFYRAMTLMVAASPCAVIISTPAAVLSAIASGGRQGVLFKGGEHVEAAASIDTVAFDKTGTLTQGDTQLTDVVVRGRPDESLTDDWLLSLAAAVQARSEHHLARATVTAAKERSLEVPDAQRFQSASGKGVRAEVDASTIHIGNRSYFKTVLEGVAIEGLETGLDRLETLESEGKTSVIVAQTNGDGEGDSVSVLGWLAFTDTVRPGAAEMIDDLRSLGVEHIMMLTGDNERVAQRIADEVGIDDVEAALLPEEKVEIIEALVDNNEHVAMVGDGVNDAPALAIATLGIAMGGAGTDVALDTADVVLMGDNLSKIPYVLGLGRKTRRTLTVNLAIAFGAIALMVGTILLRGIPLPLAVVGHEGSTVLVSLNGLRLLGFRGEERYGSKSVLRR